MLWVNRQKCPVHWTQIRKIPSSGLGRSGTFAIFCQRRILPGVDKDFEAIRQREFAFKFGILHEHTIPPSQKNKETYLRRHKLLMPGEAKRIGEGYPFADGPSLWDSHLKDVFEPAA